MQRRKTFNSISHIQQRYLRMDCCLHVGASQSCGSMLDYQSISPGFKLDCKLGLIYKLLMIIHYFSILLTPEVLKMQHFAPFRQICLPQQPPKTPDLVLLHCELDYNKKKNKIFRFLKKQKEDSGIVNFLKKFTQGSRDKKQTLRPKMQCLISPPTSLGGLHICFTIYIIKML